MSEGGFLRTLWEGGYGGRALRKGGCGTIVRVGV